jgi:hypothetical protein
VHQVGTSGWRWAWVALALALAVHVLDEALTGFLPVYNATTAGIRARQPWIPLPTFTFGIWLGGLIAGIVLLLCLTPFVSRGARWIRIVSIALGLLMAGNALVHLGASIAWGRVAPGAYSSPLLLAVGLALVVTAARART